MADEPLPVLPGVLVTPGFYSPQDYVEAQAEAARLYEAMVQGQLYQGGQYTGGSPPPPVSPNETAPVLDEDSGLPVEILVEAEKDTTPVEQWSDDELLQSAYDYGRDVQLDELENRGYIFEEGSYTSPADREALGLNYFVGPLVTPGAAIARVLLGALGAVLLDKAETFFEAGQREGPVPPRKPPDPPAFDFFQPELPNWEDIANEPYINYPEPDTILPEIAVDAFRVGGLLTGLEWWLRPGQLGDDLIGRILPIGDNPGLLANPGLFPDLPAPSIPFPKPVVRPAPRPVTRPEPARPAPDPLSDPYAPFWPDPRPIAEPEPRVRPIPDPIGDPYSPPIPVADPYNPVIPRIGDPISDPLTPWLPYFPGAPEPYLPPLMDPQFIEFPLGSPDMPPIDTSNCPPCKKEKKKKKKKKPRRICYRGTYREYAKGLSKSRLEEIPCEPTKPRTKRDGAKKPRTNPRFPDLAKDIFGLP